MRQRSLLLATSMIVGVTAASSVWAQTASSEPTTAATATPPAAEVEAIVVTGSRIKRNAFNSASPIQVITSQQSELEGLVDSSEILQSSSLASGSFQAGNELTGYVVTGGPGVNTASLRGLGATRTLYLLNGRRVGPAGVRGTVGPVDLNVLPSSIVDQIVILKDGASSIYGSDAVAGVVNYVTKTNLDGGSLKLYGNTPWSSGGGGATWQASGSWGKTFDKGYVTVSGDYYKQTALRRGDRDQTKCASDYLFSPTTGASVDFKEYGTSDVKCYNQLNNVLSSSTYGTLQYLKPGVTYPTSAAGNNSIFTDLARQARANYPETYSYANYSSPYWDRATAISPVQRTSLFLTGGYHLNDSIEAYGEALFNRRLSEQDSLRQLFPTLAATNPNNRFGAAGGTVYPVISIPYDSKQDVKYARMLGGFRGDFGDKLKGWDWDVYGQYSQSSGDYSISSVYNDRVLATTAYGVACQQSAITISGGSCSDLPSTGIPWTSARIAAGQFTDAEKAFLFGVDRGHTDYTQTMFEASTSGDVFQLPAGPLAVAVGVAYRHDKIDDQPGRESVNSNNWGLTAAGHTVGSDSVKEAFGEFQAPLLKDLPFVQKLDLQVSGRYTDYKSYGDGTTYKYGLNWQVIPSVRLRYSKGTSFRAPALYELYLANQTSYSSSTTIDPCVNYQDSANATLQANCAAAGVPQNYTGGGPSALVIAGGGKGVLKAETSDSYNVGLIWTPSFIHLDAALEYYEITLENEITQLGAGNIASMCYSSPAGLSNDYCSLLTRDATTHYITSVKNSYINVANQWQRGIDLTVNYSHEFDAGKLTLTGDFSWQLEDVVQVLATTYEDSNGRTYGYSSTTSGYGPDFTSTLRATFARDDWSVNWSVDIRGKGSDTEYYGKDVFGSTRYASLTDYDYITGTTRYKNVYYKQYAELTAYHSVSLRKKLDDYTITVGVQNLFNEEAPNASTGQFRVGTAAYGYDLKGRRSFVTLEKKW
jgi:iron complex outermembrane receptor protein